MQRILLDGHHDEVASVGSRLAGYFEVFHNLMAKRLEEMLQADDNRMSALTTELLVCLLSCLYRFTQRAVGTMMDNSMPALTRKFAGVNIMPYKSMPSMEVQ